MTASIEPLDRGAGARWPVALAWLPLFALPALVCIWGVRWPAWKLMCGLAVSVYAGLKWLTLVDFVRRTRGLSVVALLRRGGGYLLFWPGMDPQPFFAASCEVERPRAREWLAAVAKLAGGVATVSAAAALAEERPYLAGAAGILGLVFVFHFGLFHVLSLVWRRQGVAAAPIMNAPLQATSLAAFWGRQWNLAFRDLAHRFVFRPAKRRFGAAAATMLVFLFSGLIHDVVISLPVGRGYGLPTLYFALQGIGVLVERSKLARRLGLGRGAIGWAYCLVLTLGPIGMLFHRAFVEQAIAPMLAALARAV